VSSLAGPGAACSDSEAGEGSSSAGYVWTEGKNRKGPPRYRGGVRVYLLVDSASRIGGDNNASKRKVGSNTWGGGLEGERGGKSL